MLLARPQNERSMQQKLDPNRPATPPQPMVILPAMEPAKLFCDQRIALFDERMLEAKRER